LTKVSLQSLSKHFENTVVVDAIDLDIEDKELVVLVGPSGCGKSTTLRMIAGLEEPTGGEILIGDKVVTDLEPKDRNVAMVFQNYALYPHMSVADNMGFGLKMRGVSSAEIEKRIRWSAGILGIENLLKRRPKHLSGGQRQRVALGRAIVREPSVFLLDEPLSNLDAKLRVHMRSEIVKLHRRLQATMVYVTHDQVEAMSMGDRIVVMADGVIQQVGPPMEVYSRPVNTFVAGFVGSRSMNFITATLRQEGDRFLAEFGDSRIVVPAHDPTALKERAGQAVTLGIRPEHLQVGPDRSDKAKLSDPIAAQVQVAEALGSSRVLELTTGGLTVIAETSPDLLAAVGDTVELRFDMEHLHLFDAVTGRVFSAAP
jgi:multiple sugar transport system ATP-binding protein